MLDCKRSLFSKFCLLGMVACLYAQGCGRNPLPHSPDSYTPAPNSTEPRPFVSNILLEDQAGELGCNHRYQDGREAGLFSILEVTGGAVGLLDYDRDGLCDTFLLGGGRFHPSERKSSGLPSELYRNTPRGVWSPSAQKALIPPPSFFPLGLAIGDVNEDGYEDLLVTGYSGVQLLVNQGDGSFWDSTVPIPPSSQICASGAAFADLDGDGLSDLFMANYVDWSFDRRPGCPASWNAERTDVCSPLQFRGLPTIALRNSGGGDWVMFPSDSGLVYTVRGLGVLACDFDQDSRIDLYVANDAEPNLLLTSASGTTYQNSATLSGVACGSSSIPGGSMGIAFGDLDRDGQFDFVVTNFLRDVVAIYRQRNHRTFQYFSPAAGVNQVSGFVAWGTALVDLDCDGWVDLPVLNGDVFHNAPPHGDPRQRGLLFAGRGKGQLSEVTKNASYFLSQLHAARGLAIGDLNNDGLPDMLVACVNEPVGVLVNRSKKHGNFITLDLIGVTSPRIPVGTTVVVDCGEQRWSTQLTNGGSYLSAHQNRLFIGLGSAQAIDRMTVLWPSKNSSQYENMEVNRHYIIVEGKNLPLFED